MIRSFRRIGVIAALFATSGCTYGFLYSDTTRPLVADMRGQPFIEERSLGDSNVLQEPLTGAGLRIEWSSHAIGDIAKLRGIDKIQYADIRSISVLGGIFQRRIVSVYGQRGLQTSGNVD